jgi:hypothetical protein
MKSKFLISICLLYSSIFLFSCGGSSLVEPDLPDTPELPTPEISADTVEVSVNSAIHIDSELLSTRSSINDLYAIQVWQKVPTTNEVGFSWTECWTYAHGYFDDLSKAVIKLAKRYKYGITIAYIPNGKNLLHQYPDGVYGAPCYNAFGENGALNELVYGDGFALMHIDSGGTQVKGIDDYKIQSNGWSPIERYQGVVVDFDPNTESTINIKLYRMMIGFKLNISDFNNGVVTISGVHGHQYHAYPDGNGNGTLDIVIETDVMPTATNILWAYEQQMYGEYDLEHYTNLLLHNNTMQVHISYTNEGGETINLYRNQYFEYTRNTKYTLSFSLSDAIRNGGISAEVVEDNEMGEEEFPL